MGAITQSFIYSFESNLQHEVQSAWEFVQGSLWWQRIATTRPSSTLKEIYEWQISNAAIHDMGKEGAQKFFADLASQQFTIENKYWGESLKLSRRKIEDNEYDIAAQWASDIGEAGGYHPQRLVVDLIKNGTTRTCYDGKAFFATDHPYNPSNAGAGTYANLYTQNAATDPFDLNPANLAEAYALVEQIMQPDGRTPRYLKGTQLLVAPQKRSTAALLTGAKMITDPTNASGGASADNMLASMTDFGFVPPIVVPEFADEPHVWYLAVPNVRRSPMKGALIFQEREAFKLSTYTTATDVELMRTNQFEWHYEGRSVAQYGDPFLLFRFEGTEP
jgi:phage major head subunit gpT-like protein